MKLTKTYIRKVILEELQNIQEKERAEQIIDSDDIQKAVDLIVASYKGNISEATKLGTLGALGLAAASMFGGGKAQAATPSAARQLNTPAITSTAKAEAKLDYNTKCILAGLMDRYIQTKFNNADIQVRAEANQLLMQKLEIIARSQTIQDIKSSGKLPTIAVQAYESLKGNEKALQTAQSKGNNLLSNFTKGLGSVKDIAK